MDRDEDTQLRDLATRAHDAFLRKDFVDALSLGRELQRRFTHDPVGWFHVARALRDSGQLEECEGVLFSAPERFPNDLPILSIWVSLPRARRDLEEALRRANWLLDRFPNDPSPYTHLARSLLAAGKKTEATEVIATGLTRWPDNLGLTDTYRELSSL